jgi:broad specificity polyphosphatase/5'/3'-nucleotidase SurE
MKILISNDDGIYSPGIVALGSVASSFGDALRNRVVGRL